MEKQFTKLEEEKKDGSDSKRLNLILIAILVVSILDFITNLIRG